MKGFVRVVLFATGLALGFASIAECATGLSTENSGGVVTHTETVALLP